MPVIGLRLAKELFDAGFPQEISNSQKFYDDDGALLTRHPELPFPQVGKYRSPGLGVLVDACIDHLRSLRFEAGQWYANDACGNTPEEAVARLWLQMHQRNTGQ